MLDFTFARLLHGHLLWLRSRDKALRIQHRRYGRPELLPVESFAMQDIVSRVRAALWRCFRSSNANNLCDERDSVFDVYLFVQINSYSQNIQGLDVQCSTRQSRRR
jgi:hypothetical protein